MCPRQRVSSRYHAAHDAFCCLHRYVLAQAAAMLHLPCQHPGYHGSAACWADVAWLQPRDSAGATPRDAKITGYLVKSPDFLCSGSPRVATPAASAECVQHEHTIFRSSSRTTGKVGKYHALRAPQIRCLLLRTPRVCAKPPDLG